MKNSSINNCQKAAFYLLFAAISAITNLGVQHVFFIVYDGMAKLFIGMAFGTAAGLIVKYLLDKKWIFEYSTVSASDGVIKFGLYSLMGVLTTLEFWFVEYLFDLLIHQSWSKYLGGSIGLFIGYILKYNLDKKFVFQKNESAQFTSKDI